MLRFYTPWKRQKTRGFLTFSENTKIENWLQIGYVAKISKKLTFPNPWYAHVRVTCIRGKKY